MANEVGPTLNGLTIWILIALALIVIISACFNYTNLSIARALKRLLCDNDLVQQLGKKGRKWIETQMNWDCVAEQMHDSIQRLM